MKNLFYLLLFLVLGLNVWTALGAVGGAITTGPNSVNEQAANTMSSYIGPTFYRFQEAYEGTTDKVDPTGPMLLMNFSDSMGLEGSSSSMTGPLFEMLSRTHGTVGYDLMVAGNRMRLFPVGTTSVAGPDANWFMQYLKIPNAQSLYYSNDFHVDGVFADTIGLYWMRQSLGGTFDITTSLNGAAYTVLKTVSGANATLQGAFTNVAVTPGRYRIKINSTSGENWVIGPQFRYVNNGYGVVQACLGGAGIALSGVNGVSTVPRAVRDVVLTNMCSGVSGGMIVCHWKEDGSVATAVAMGEACSWLSMATNMSVVWVGTPYGLVDDSIPNYTLSQNMLCRSNAIFFGQSYVDLMTPYINHGAMVTNGYDADGTHVTLRWCRDATWRFLKDFGLDNIGVANNWRRSPVTFFGNATVDRGPFRAALTTTYTPISGPSTTIGFADGIYFTTAQTLDAASYGITGNDSATVVNAPNAASYLLFGFNNGDIKQIIYRSGGIMLGGNPGIDPGSGNVYCQNGTLFNAIQNPYPAAGANIGGTDLTMSGGTGTGTGNGGRVVIKTSLPGGAGSGVNAAVIRNVIAGKEVAITKSVATTVLNITLGTGKSFGARLFTTVRANDATDFQTISDCIVVTAVNKAGTVTTSISASTPSANSVSTGTITSTWTAVVNGASVDIKCNAVPSLTPTTLVAQYALDLNINDSAATVN